MKRLSEAAHSNLSTLNKCFKLSYSYMVKLTSKKILTLL